MLDIRKDDVNTPKVIRLDEYEVPAYLVRKLELTFELSASETRVSSCMEVYKNPASDQKRDVMVLNCVDLPLLGLKIDGIDIEEDYYEIKEESLVIHNVPQQFVLETETQIAPDQNTALEGLYASGSMLCTQCEAEGFRRITFFPDRPDVMSEFTVKMIADKYQHPVLLSNGNLIDSGELGDNLHYATWHDPSLKPSYLFALVAGDLEFIEDSFTTMSDRNVVLRLFTEKENIHKCKHAMTSLKQSMLWDEQTYGREYDLDIFMIVAVNDFNMGAMENKGLNIFNSSCVLASPETATDHDYYNIQSIIGHEYFHNWSGNRVTCRDWFQLSLKEGFTVFRDQEFSADLNSRVIQRIDDVDVLRNFQFAEDSGPMAHPIRPDHYMEISNFYTVTVYNKGAEVVRMLSNIAGVDGFRKGTDLYFSRHDGQAVTCEDFVRAIEDANDLDLSQFKNWYSQAGTPTLKAQGEYDSENQTYSLTLEQHTDATPGQALKVDFWIPVAVGLVDNKGNDIPLSLEGEQGDATGTTRVLNLRKKKQVFTFTNIPCVPFLSLLRGFSAPVNVEVSRDDSELAFLLEHDSDPFNCWDAGQTLAMNEILRQVKRYKHAEPFTEPVALIDALAGLVKNTDMDKALLASILKLPGENFIADQCDVVDVDAIYHAREHVSNCISKSLYNDFSRLYQENNTGRDYVFIKEDMAEREIKNISLMYLMRNGSDDDFKRGFEQFESANNMTDREAALSMLTHYDINYRSQALDAFYNQWKHDQQVVEKWMSIQASSRLPDTLQSVKALTEHEAFSMTNPNKVRSLIGAFCRSNPVRFHAASGEGYAFLSETIMLLDSMNPQIAARLAQIFSKWRRFDEQRQQLMSQALTQILKKPDLSKDVYEVVNKMLE